MTPLKQIERAIGTSYKKVSELSDIILSILARVNTRREKVKLMECVLRLRRVCPFRYRPGVNTPRARGLDDARFMEVAAIVGEEVDSFIQESWGFNLSPARLSRRILDFLEKFNNDREQLVVAFAIILNSHIVPYGKVPDSWWNDFPELNFQTANPALKRSVAIAVHIGFAPDKSMNQRIAALSRLLARHRRAEEISLLGGMFLNAHLRAMGGRAAVLIGANMRPSGRPLGPENEGGEEEECRDPLCPKHGVRARQNAALKPN